MILDTHKFTLKLCITPSDESLEWEYSTCFGESNGHFFII